jgi:hypothetical protein
MQTKQLREVRLPTMRDVKIYFNQKGMPDYEAQCFFKFYEKQKWSTRNGNRIMNGKSLRTDGLAQWCKINRYFLIDTCINDGLIIKKFYLCTTSVSFLIHGRYMTAKRIVADF